LSRRVKRFLSGKGLVLVGAGRMWGKGIGGRIWSKYCVHMYVNGKMRSAETIPELGEGRIEENDGRGEFKYDMFDIL
jgi:hypothetical protein